MAKFLLLYHGPATPQDASHEGWREWFTKLGENLLDNGSPMFHGQSVHGDGSADDSATRLNGYSIIQAEDRNTAITMLRDHPYLALGTAYTIEMFDIR